MPRGRLPTSTVAVTSIVSPSITVMELPFSLDTKMVIAPAGARGSIAATLRTARDRIVAFLMLFLSYSYHCRAQSDRSEEHTSELQSLMRISYAVFCLKKKKYKHTTTTLLLTSLYIYSYRITSRPTVS